MDKGKDGTVTTVTGRQVTRFSSSGFMASTGARVFCFPQRPDSSLVLANGHRCLFPRVEGHRVISPTTDLHLVLRLRMSGSISVFPPHTFILCVGSRSLLTLTNLRKQRLILRCVERNIGFLSKLSKICIKKKKDKVIPLQVRCGPEGG